MSVRKGASLLLPGEFLYVPMIKCASSTMRQALGKLGAVDVNFLDTPLRPVQPVLIVLRDPLMRFISAYNHCHQWANLGTPQEVLDAGEDRHFHFLPQTWFLDHLLPNIVGRVGNLAGLSEHLNIHLPMVNKGQHSVFKRYDTQELRQNIVDLYAVDYELLEKYPDTCGKTHR